MLKKKLPKINVPWAKKRRYMYVRTDIDVFHEIFDEEEKYMNDTQ